MFTIIADCGNSAIKALLLDSQGNLVQQMIMPSLISFRYSDFIEGGFTKVGKETHESVVVGHDNEGRSDSLNMVDSDNGKIEYLHYLLAGVVSGFEPHLRKDTNVNWIVLTLNPDKRSRIQDAITYASSLNVDTKPLKLRSTLVNVLPESAGAAYYAMQMFKGYERVGVLEIGHGTCNLSTYSTHGLYPRRSSFRFVPAGVSKLLAVVSELLTNDTSNGRVDERLINIAVTTNTNRYFSDYNGRDITDYVNTATEHWLHDGKLKPLIIEVIRLLLSGVPIVTAGGGICIKSLRDALELMVLANIGDSSMWHVPESPHTLGVVGLQSLTKVAYEAQTTND